MAEQSLHSNVKNITGQKFGRMLVIRHVGRDRSRNALWLCQCDCGRQKIVKGNCLRRGVISSCKCFSRELLAKRNQSHGYAGTPTYKSWASMVARCRPERRHQKDASRYAGRGIRVCERWLTFEKFFADMGERPQDCTLDRIDVNGHYTPENCRWATREQQANNKTTTVRLTIDGTTKSLGEWERESPVTYCAIMNRLLRGWSSKEAVFAKPQPGRKWKERARPH